MRKIEIRVNVAAFQIKDLKQGNEISPASSMKSGEMVINGSGFPFILKKRIFGRLRGITDGLTGQIALVIFDHQPITKYTKAGYVNFSLVFPAVQISVYLKKGYFKKFIAAATFNLLET